MFTFEGTIKSAVKNGVVEFQIVPTSQYSIKDSNGKIYYVAFDGNNLIPVSDVRLTRKMSIRNSKLIPLFSAHAASGRAIQFEFDDATDILKEDQGNPQER